MENHQIYGFACTIKYISVAVVVVAFRLISLLDFHAIICASHCSIVSQHYGRLPWMAAAAIIRKWRWLSFSNCL